MTRRSKVVLGFWMVTALFCLQIGFTYAGFAINLVSALIAHVAVGEGPDAWGWAVATGVLWALSYFFWRRLQAAPSTTTWSYV